MITKAQAVSAHHRQEFHSGTIRNADGTPARCRVNGACQTWKTRPDEFRLPVKHGLKQCFNITQDSAFAWYATAEEAMQHGKVQS